jgi:hypothetical protein
MRTKALFLSAAAGLATLVATQAQVVYSVNVVGYVNVTLDAGWTMVSNPLDNGAGNLVTDLMPAAETAAGTQVYKWNGEGFDTLTLQFGAWNPAPAEAIDMTMNPGEGVFISSGSEQSVTFVGEVKEGANDVVLPQGWSIFSSVAPVTTDLSDAEVAFPAENGDNFYRYDQSLNGGAGGYVPGSYSFGSWITPMVLEPGQATWVSKQTEQTWTRTFDVPRE